MQQLLLLKTSCVLLQQPAASSCCVPAALDRAVTAWRPQEKINLARGEASAIEARAVANSKAVQMLAQAMNGEGGHDASALRVAEQYVAAFQSLAASGSTVVVPANAGDVGAMVAQAMAIYRKGATAKEALAAVQACAMHLEPLRAPLP